MNRITDLGPEKDKLDGLLLALHPTSPLYMQVYAARQALMWAIHPEAFRSPYNMLTEAAFQPVTAPKSA